MKTVTGHTRLFRRGATYYHRAVVPADIRTTYGKTEETFSLKTKDYQEALRRVRVEAVRVDKLFDEHRRQQNPLPVKPVPAKPMLRELSDAQIKLIRDAYYRYRLEEDDERRAEGFYDPDEERPFNPTPSFEEYSEVIDDLNAMNRADYARGKVDRFFESEVDEVLQWDGIDLNLDPASPSRRKLGRALQEASIRADESIVERNSGKVVDTPAGPAVEVASDMALLSKASEEWIAEKSRSKWVPKTAHEQRVWMGHFIDVVGDRPITDYTKADARAFKGLLLKLPPNWNKNAKLKGLPLERAAEEAERLELPSMSNANINKIIGFVGSFWTWAEDNYKDGLGNPFKGLKVKVRKDVREERHPFTCEELNKIFSAPIYTGCESLRNWKSHGNCVPGDSGKYWVPLISLFTGARLGEIIQLYVSDIREDAGISYFDLNKEEDDKRLKTHTSKRVIPIHPTLVQIGFLDFVDRRRKTGDARLFPDLNMGKDGYYSTPFSKYFKRFLDSLGIKHRKNAFHSFRHNFEDACVNSGVEAEVRDSLQGHGVSGMAGRYGWGRALATMDCQVQVLRYDGLDLTHLLFDG